VSALIDIWDRFRGGLRVVGLAIASTRDTVAQPDSAVPTLTSGTGVPDHAAPNGSVFLRTNGGSSSTVYTRVSGAWAALGDGVALSVGDDTTLFWGAGSDFGIEYDEDGTDDARIVQGASDPDLVFPDDMLCMFGTDKDVWLEYDEDGTNVGVLGGTNGWEARCPLWTTEGIASGTARKVGGIALSDPVVSTAVTGATETQTSFDHGSYTVPANTLKVGTIVRVRARGRVTAATGAEVHVLGLAFGATTLCVSGNLDSVTNNVFDIEFEFVVRAIGASGTVVGAGVVRDGPQAAAPTTTHMLATGSAGTSTTTIDTTASAALAVFVDRQATATDGDSMRLDSFAVEIIG
jgi:hypothetical protein